MSLDHLFNLLWPALLQTMTMVVCTGVLTAVFGVPLGFILFATRPGGLMAHPVCHHSLATLTNFLRSIPFIILMVAIVPFTRWITGTSIGTVAAMVPLVIAAIPFFGRMVENTLIEVPHGLIEAAESMGASPMQIMRHVLLPEALPSIIHAFTVTMVALIGYSAMAGAVGGGGLGDLGVRYGYQRFNPTMMLTTVLVLVVLVQCLQSLGDALAKYFDRR